jgi:acyl-CoA synthetase (AMP-forming)/AMP-acid ligase II
MPVEVLRGFEEAFGCKVLEGYGLSESCAIATFNRPDRERKPGSIGLPVMDTELELVDDDGNEVPEGDLGEIVMRGPTVMKGYWNRPDATRETLADDWVKTGDMARRDEDGYYFIVDRKKELIIRDGAAAHPAGAARVRQGARGRIQVPAPRLAGGRAAQGPDGQDPQARDRDPRGARELLTGRDEPSVAGRDGACRVTAPLRP